MVMIIILVLLISFNLHAQIKDDLDFIIQHHPAIQIENNHMDKNRFRETSEIKLLGISIIHVYQTFILVVVLS